MNVSNEELQKAGCCIVYALHCLRAQGVNVGGAFELAPEFLAQYRAIAATGYKPSSQLIHAIVPMLAINGVRLRRPARLAAKVDRFFAGAPTEGRPA